MNGARDRTGPVALLTLLAALVLPGPAIAADGQLQGVVLDTTCYGPCVLPGEPPPPYLGEGLAVRVRTFPDRVLVATLRPADGRFRIDLPAGVYRISARVGDDPIGCWDGETKRRSVGEAEVRRVILRVENICIQ